MEGVEDMFRVQDNEDGTTSIFCGNTGKHIYTLRPNNTSRIPERRASVSRPINVVGPSPQVNPLNVHKTESVLKTESVPDQDVDLTRNAKCCVSPIPIVLEKERITEDYFNVTATQDEFARCLNLVPKRRFIEEPIESIFKDFPLRLLSRSKEFRSVDISSEDWHFHKPPDDLPLSSNLGVKFLKVHENRNFLNDQKLSIAIKKYDAFCRFPFNSPNPSECNFPKLRCREKKSYPTLSTKASKHEGTHVYTYGRRQRMERMITLRTGIDKESRRLLRMCNARKCFVKLKRLHEEEIKDWLSRRTVPPVIIIDDSDDDLDMMYDSNKYLSSVKPAILPDKINSSLVSMNNGRNNAFTAICYSNNNRTLVSLLSLPTSSKINGQPLVQSSIQQRPQSLLKKVEDRRLAIRNGCKKCSVRLVDVTRRLHKIQGDYFVKSTNIRVRSYAKLKTVDNGSNVFKRDHATNDLKQVRPRSLSVSLNRTLNAQCKTGFTNRSITESPVKFQLKQQNPLLVATAQPRSSSAPLESVNSNTGLRIIPYIDLTEDSPPRKIFSPKRPVLSRSEFICYGCNFKESFDCRFDQNDKNNPVRTAVYDHMKIYHFVTQPSAFMSYDEDLIKNCIVIETFPGYKK